MPKIQLQVAKYYQSYTVFFKQWIRTYGFVVKTDYRESGDVGWIPDECWNSCCTPAILCGTEPDSACQCTDTLAFNIAVLSIFFFFRQWRSRADRVVNLNRTIWLALFWRTWTRARACTRPHALAWHMGRDTSYYRALELTDLQVSGFVFSWFLENTEKTKASKETFLSLMPLAGWSSAFKLFQ